MRLRPRTTRTAILAAIVGLIVAAIASPAVQPQAPVSTFELAEVGIRELQQRMSDGRETSRSVTQTYLTRIEALNRRGPDLRAVLEVNPDALAIADRLDAERKAGRIRGPLHGIPLLVKDNIATGDRMLTSAGSLLFTQPAPRDAFLVTRLRDAGAVLLGKTNLSEWANFRSTHSSSGWSARGGQTRNPYVLDRNPSGSSSGSAVGVAVSMAAAAVGTETDGSIVSPASVNGLVGMKPTLGLISRTGVVPIAHSQDTAGPMARTVTDLAVVLTALAAPDPADPVTLSRARPAAIDYTQALDPQGLRGARIGVVRTRLFGYAPAVDALADAAIAALKAQGAVIVDPVTIETLGAFDDLEFEVLLHEFKSDLRDFFRWWGPTAPARTLGDVIAFNSTRAEELAYFGQELMLQAEGKGPLTAAPYREALARARRLARTEGIDRAMTRYRLDALVAPTGGVAWPIDLATGDSGSAFTPSPSTITSVAGYPHITVPMGLVGRLPVGFSFFGRAWSDARLVTYAYAYEQATRLRRPPAFAPTSD